MDWSGRSLCLLFTPQLCAGDPWRTLAEALDAGLPLVQWRVKTPDREGLLRCMEACAPHDVPVIVNDHVQLAADVDAAGAHVGQDDMSAERAGELLASEQVLGVSTHDLEQALGADDAGADYIGLGPCHPTATKGYDEALPDRVLTEVRDTIDLPIFAIGGVTADNAGRLRDLGFEHFAVSSAVLAATRPAEAVERLLRATTGTTP